MSMTQEEIDQLIQSGGVDDDAIQSSAIGSEEEITHTPKTEFHEIDYGRAGAFPTIDPKLELLYDLQLPVTIELGRTNMLIRNILRLGRGSVIEFDKLVSEPVDVLINGKKVAEGEVVVIDKHFGIRVTTLVDPSDRLRIMKK